MYSTVFISKSIGGRIVRLAHRLVHRLRRPIRMHCCLSHHHDGRWHHSREDQLLQRVRPPVGRMVVDLVVVFLFPMT